MAIKSPVRKLERAEQHIRDLKTFWHKFRDEKHAYRVLHEDNPKTGYRVYRLSHVLPMPPDVSLILGDAVHNLRCAMDHIAYLIALKVTGGAGPFKSLYFPVGEDACEFEKALLRAKECKTRTLGVVKRLGPDEIKAFRSIQPYGGGRGELLWNIHQLDLRDKHYLVLAVGSTNSRQSMSPRDRTKITKEFLGIEDDSLTPEMASAMYLEAPPRTIFPLKTGTKLRCVPLPEVDEHAQFVFEVAFGEPEILKGKPVLVTLQRAAKLVRDIIRDFDRAGLLA